MPDFTIEIFQQCVPKSYDIGGYRQQFDPEYGYTCSCKGYQFHHHCKHVAQIEHCGWHGAYDEPQTPEQEANMKCPRCGGETEYVRVAV